MNREFPNAYDSSTLPERVVTRLREWLEMELTAVETYELALRSTSDPIVSRTFSELRDDHALRADEVRRYARSLGITLSDTASVFRAFAKLVQHGADILGDRTAIAALEELEDRAVVLYAKHDETNGFMTKLHGKLAAEQRKSHERCSSLKQLLKRS